MRKSFTLLCVSIALQFRVVNLYYICRVFVEVISKALCFKTKCVCFIFASAKAFVGFFICMQWSHLVRQNNLIIVKTYCSGFFYPFHMGSKSFWFCMPRRSSICCQRQWNHARWIEFLHILFQAQCFAHYPSFIP